MTIQTSSLVKFVSFWMPNLIQIFNRLLLAACYIDVYSITACYEAPRIYQEVFKTFLDIYQGRCWAQPLCSVWSQLIQGPLKIWTEHFTQSQTWPFFWQTTYFCIWNNPERTKQFSLNNLIIRHDSEFAKFWPRALQT